MGQDPQRTKSRNVANPTPDPPLLHERYTTEVRRPIASHELQNGDGALVAFLQAFRSDGDRGYLRIIDTDASEVWYVKWKWTAGLYAGHYVFDSCIDGDISACLRRLLKKVAQVRAKQLRPTKDKQYG
jgi:hypothetical protein